ncbi:MAG TPA: HypC/HybG/HupF family hydrogenase formation chaperone [Clostridia bacterium]|nr:HypC/HybG/HupF family hydrogenase formation chaperone [Clostridia bacterium]
MCLSIPSKVVSIDGEFAEVDFQGVRKLVGISLLNDVKVGDYLLVHSGFAIQKVNEKEALETLKCWEEIESAGGIG